MKGKIFVHGSWDDIMIDYENLSVNYLDKVINVKTVDAITQLILEYKSRNRFIEQEPLKPLLYMGNFDFR